MSGSCLGLDTGHLGCLSWYSTVLPENHELLPQSHQWPLSSITITIIGKTALFEPWPSLGDSARFVFNQTIGFHFFGFRNNHFLQSNIVNLASNPQPGGPGLYIYVPQWQGGQVIPTGTGFPSRHLLRLEELSWRYSSPPPHGKLPPTYFVILHSWSANHSTAHSLSY
jgi:hypothetical protein